MQETLKSTIYCFDLVETRLFAYIERNGRGYSSRDKCSCTYILCLLMQSFPVLHWLQLLNHFLQ